jgi:arylsulfatase A-like enzyme
MNREIRRLAALLIAFACVASGCTSPNSAASTDRCGLSGASTVGADRSERPNVLIIVTDDQRSYDSLKVMPQTRQWFATGGTRFINAFSTTPLCCPARASIMTGRYSHNTGVLRNQRGGDLDTTTTLQAYLSNAGYRTAIAGKYLQGLTLDIDPPHFDRWATFKWRYFDATFNLDGQAVRTNGYSTDYVASRAVCFLRDFERTDGDPWFLYLAPFAPHTPYQPEPAYAEAKTPKWKRYPSFFEGTNGQPPFLDRHRLTWPRARSVHRRQLRTLMSVDDLVGRVFRTMSELKEGRDTLAFFVSDNGLLLGEHRLYAKRLPYTPSIKVPLLMRWPKRVPAGRVDSRLAANLDIAPTVLAAARLRPADGAPLDGRSLINGSRRRRLFLEQWDNYKKNLRSWASIRTRRYQYIEYYNRHENKIIFRQFYDLRDDPFQRKDLLHDRKRSNDPRNISQLRSAMAAYKTCSGVGCR